MRIYVKLKSYHPYYLEKFFFRVQKNVNSLTGALCTQVFLPKKLERFTVLRSPHVDKKARDQFERITYKRLLILEIPNDQALNRLFFFLKNISVGVQTQILFNKNYV